MAFTIEENIDLKPYNTFHVQARARYFVRIQSMSDLKLLFHEPIYKNNKRLILGGGSNCVFVHDFDGLVIKVETRGIDVLHERDTEIHVRVASGEVWHDFVLHCLSKNWGGVENLSLIPGTVGAAPIQNIGAYGVEVKELIECVDGVSLEDGVARTFTNEECKFLYRESIFKHAWSKIFFISSITLRLTTKNHRINSSYGGLNEHLLKQNITAPTIHDVSRSVVAIRRSKLPDPAVLGNAGSFFKNPIITSEQLKKLQIYYPTIPFYPSDNQLIKVPAGWLIEKAGWKGKRIDQVGVHEHQALVIVNHQDARGEEIFSLSQQIIDDVNQKFNIQLNREVNIIV
jgi:UDP-N-acetylmuramate dehydrogenase